MNTTVLLCALSGGCFPIYYLRNQNVFVHLGECLQLTPDTLVASVTVTRQEKTSSIKTVFLRFKSSLAIIFSSTVVAFLGLKNTLEFIGYRRFFLVIIEASAYSDLSSEKLGADQDQVSQASGIRTLT